MERLIRSAGQALGPMAAWAGGIVLITAVLGFKLGSLTHGLDMQEYSIRIALNNNSLGFLEICRHAVNLPYQLGLYLLQALPLHNSGSLRAFGVVVGVASCASFFYLLKHWYDTKVAIFGTVLFASSSWLLHSTRYASAECLYPASVVIISFWIWLQKQRHQGLAFTLFCFMSTLALYVPGVILVVVPLSLWYRKPLSRFFDNTPVIWQTAAILGSIVLALPLIASFVWPADSSSALQMAKSLLGLPARVPSVTQYIHNLLQVIENIFVSSTRTPVWHLARLPFLDIFSSAIFMVGLISMIRTYRLDRSKFVLAALLYGWLISAFSGNVADTILLPFVYIVIAGGLQNLLRQWLTVFPRNPFARGLGFSVIGLAIALVAGYQLFSYYVAWPHNPGTKSTFSHHL